MSDLERQIYADMKSTDRILIWMTKCEELLEFSEIMTDEDIKSAFKACKLMKKEATTCSK